MVGVAIFADETGMLRAAQRPKRSARPGADWLAARAGWHSQPEGEHTNVGMRT